MTHKRKHDTADGVRDQSDPLPNSRLDEVQNDKVDASSTATRRGTLRMIGGAAIGSTVIGAAAACDKATDDEASDREQAESRGLTREFKPYDDEAPTDRTNGDSDLGMSLSGQEFVANGEGGTACHSMHVARGRKGDTWWYDLIDVTNYGGPDSSSGEPALELHRSYFAEGGTVVFLVAENDHGMLASPDASAFTELLPDRIREEAVGL